MRLVTITSKSFVYTIIGDIVISPLENKSIDIDQLPQNNLKSLVNLYLQKQVGLQLSDYEYIANKIAVASSGVGSIEFPVTSVNTLKGNVVLTPAIINADPAGSASTVKTNLEATIKTNKTDADATKASVVTLTNNKADKSSVASTDVIPEGVSRLYFTNDRVNKSTYNLSTIAAPSRQVPGTPVAVVDGDSLAMVIDKLQNQITHLFSLHPPE